MQLTAAAAAARHKEVELLPYRKTPLWWKEP